MGETEERPKAAGLRAGQGAERMVESAGVQVGGRSSRSAEAYMCQTCGIRDMPAASARSKASLSR